jgi:hypothetical protein
LGLPCAALHIGLMMLFIPFPFSHMFGNGKEDRHAFPHTEVSSRILRLGRKADDSSHFTSPRCCHYWSLRCWASLMIYSIFAGDTSYLFPSLRLYRLYWFIMLLAGSLV